MAVPSNSTTLPKIDRAAVMRTAWKLYRETYEFLTKLPFFRKGFRWALRKAWADLRRVAAVRAIPSEVRTARIEAIRTEIDMLKYKSLRYDTVTMQRRLEAELAALAA